jgi:hypothetical protein
MAIWQTTFHLLPKEAWKKQPAKIGTHISEFDDSVYWIGSGFDHSSFFAIEAFLPKSISWSASIELWGHQQSNLLEVFFEEGAISSVSFRIDYTTDYERIMRGFIEFAVLNGLVILNGWLEEMPYLFESFRSYIEDTDQYKLYHEMIEDKNHEKTEE